MAKTLRDHITEAETWIDRPATGDDFAINIREECLLESHIVDVVEDGIVIEADDRMIEILESYGLLEGDDNDYQDQMVRFLARGGKIQQVPMKPPRKSERLGGSRHIGGGGDTPKSRIRGISSNTQGKKVVGMAETPDPYRREVSPPSAEEFEEGVTNKHSALGKLQRHQDLKKKVDSSWQDFSASQKKGDQLAAHKAFRKHERYANLERPGTWSKVDEQSKEEGVAEGSEDQDKCRDLADLQRDPVAMRDSKVRREVMRRKQELNCDQTEMQRLRELAGVSGMQLSEGILDKIKPLIDKLKSLPVVQKNLAAARAKLPEIIAAAQQSKNGQEFVSQLSGNAPVAEGFGNVVKGAALGGLGAFEITGAAELMMAAYNSMGRPNLEQLNAGQGAAMMLLTVMMLVGAAAIGMGAKKATEPTESQRLRELAGMPPMAMPAVTEFDASDFNERYTLYASGGEVGKYSSVEDAQEEIEWSMNARPDEARKTIWTIKDESTGETVYEVDPFDIPKPGKFGFMGKPISGLGPFLKEGGTKWFIDDLYYEFMERHNIPRDIDDDTFLAMAHKFLNREGIDPEKIEDIGELFLDMRDHDEDADLHRSNNPYDIDDPAPMEAKYQGREVPLGKPMAGDVKKSKVYVRGPKGNVVKVNFGDKKMRIKKSNPKRRKNFRARHNCANPGPRWKARYWSCRAW